VIFKNRAIKRRSGGARSRILLDAEFPLYDRAALRAALNKVSHLASPFQGEE
jgi:hypothetical protein